MPFTTNINLEVPARGTYVGTWDLPNNGDFTIIDACFGTVTSVSLSSVTPVALSLSQAQANVLRFTGTLSANIVVTIPAVIKGWTVDNQCTAGVYGVFLQNASGGQQIGIPPGESIDVYSDGTNMKYRNLGRIGSYIDMGGTGVPSWVASSTIPPYLLCDGSTFSSVTYPQLAAFLGTTTLPDARGRGRFNLNGGTSRITTASSGINGDARFSSGGLQADTIVRDRLPNVTLGVTGTVTVSNPSNFLAGTGSTPLTTINGGPDGYVFDRFNQSAISLTAAFSGGATASINGGVTQQIQPLMPPAYIGGITMIRAA